MSNNDVCKYFFMQYLNYLDSDSELVVRCVYMRMKDENLLKSTLYGMHNKSVDAFVSLVLRNGTLPYLLMDGKRVIGFAWYDAFAAKSCIGHVVFFREAWGNARQFGKQVYRQLLSYNDGMGFLFDCVMGLTPINNPLAWRGAVACGASKIGVIPKALFDAENGESIDAVLTVATREIIGAEA